MTWNAFRSLRRIAPKAWLPVLWQPAFLSHPCPTDLEARVNLWKSVPPPPALLAGGNEDPSENDIVIVAPT